MPEQADATLEKTTTTIRAALRHAKAKEPSQYCPRNHDRS